VPDRKPRAERAKPEPTPTLMQFGGGLEGMIGRRAFPVFAFRAMYATTITRPTMWIGKAQNIPNGVSIRADLLVGGSLLASGEVQEGLNEVALPGPLVLAPGQFIEVLLYTSAEIELPKQVTPENVPAVTDIQIAFLAFVGG